jgi:hypothetical protein
MTTSNANTPKPLAIDRLRQVANLLLAPAQTVVTVLAFSMGVSFEEATRSDAVPPPLIPAGYAFIIWSLIYGGSVAYAIYQALPSQRENPLFRSIGFSTAMVFLGTCGWLLAARFGKTWGTVFFIFWMSFFLYLSFVPLWKRESSSASEQYLVIAPIGVFTGWVTAAAFANTASAIKVAHWRAFLFSETTWSILALLTAGALASVIIIRSRGNLWFAGTVLWALSAIAVQDFTVSRNEPVGLVALMMCAVIIGSVIGTRRRMLLRPAAQPE